MKVAGIDIGFANTGIAIMDLDSRHRPMGLPDLFLIQTEKSKVKSVRRNSDDMRRAGEVFDFLRTTIQEEGIKIVFAEIPGGSQSARSSFAFGVCLGVMAGLAPYCGLIQVQPREVKMSTGERDADKRTMIEWATGAYPEANWIYGRGQYSPYSPRNEHLADAVATIHAGLRTREFKNAVSLAKAFES